ncbi:hypothetical protein I4U23_016531 [Adineta vaga]|nr:hypothetical protein I4U23_016531 [Adineta vaga]
MNTQNAVDGDTVAVSDTNNAANSAEFGIILLGNTGVGKSFLGNILVGDEVFIHECNPSSVTHATEFQTFIFDGQTFVVFNIPGLVEDNQEAIDHNKQEIYKAFRRCPNSIIAFVFTGGSSGRVKDEDLVAFNAIHKAFNFKEESLFLIFNDLPLKKSPDYEGKTQIKMGQLINMPDVKVCFLDRIDQNNVDERYQLCMKMMEFIMNQCEPKFHRKEGDIILHIDHIQKLKDESKELQNQLEKEILKLQNTIDEKQHQYAADKVRMEHEYQTIKDQIVKQEQEAAREKAEMQRQIGELQNRSVQVICQNAKKKNRHWWKKIF